ncbi:MAG TPA: hypothetical protein VFG04_23395 [Planctomycetaceae bacterium]|nr:hypothetical protein [Planctomycetaceae bacterium]
MAEPILATQQVPAAETALSALASVERAIRDADPSAFPVASRIVRRVIRNEIDLPALIGRVPHRKSFVIAADRARQIVLNDELGLEAGAALPEILLLLARPEEHELERMTADALRDYYRRLHLHARIHVALDERLERGELNELTVAERLEQIGSSAFDEVRAVLGQEAFLLPPVSTVSVYVEFVAVFLELRYSAPDVLSAYFPSLDDFDRIEEVLSEDIDIDAVLEYTGALEVERAGRPQEQPNAIKLNTDPTATDAPLGERVFRRQLKVAAQAAASGNDVRAAILHTRASSIRDLKRSARASELAVADVRRLAGRLRVALAIDEHTANAWRELLGALLATSARGFWNPAARMLYDLQKVCLDFERESYVVDLFSWLLSFGKRPLKRRLPAQREVLMSKHLRSAASRLSKLSISAGQREHLSILLREASVYAEERLRDRLRPVLRDTLIEVGFVPQNVPERVSFRKIIEELLDHVVDSGYFAMGEIRDAIARNNLKLDDVADPLELVAGDRLLRADRRLRDELDGVYQRGAIYLRFLQGISSCAFGTGVGRFLTLYVAIPFGGAFVVLKFLEHLVELLRKLTDWWYGADASSVAPLGMTEPVFVIPLGLVLFGLAHSTRFRGAIWEVLLAIGRGARFLVVDIPLWVAEVTFINRILRSAPAVFFRRRLLTSLIFTGVFCGLLPAVGWYRFPSAPMAAMVFGALAALLNSRAGRDIEELTAEQLQLMWHRVRVHVLLAIFDLVMDFFKNVLEGVERILYEVDEWFRFKSGETGTMLWIKALLGVPWAIVRFIVAFLLTVLIEPQINPIKHFPVVTVSHKVIAPMQPALALQLVPHFGAVLANAIAGLTVLLLPGVVGFLVWELRGNWRLYAVNRRRDLRPVVVGSHGETLIRLMKLGIHSGTLPRLFAKLRRAARRADPSRRVRDLMGYYAKLHHVELHVRHFFDREFLGFLAESPAFAGLALEVGETDVGTNSLRVEIRAPELGDEQLWLAFEEQSGRVIARVWRSGWLRSLNPAQLATLRGLLVGFYRVAGADLVREQIVACLGPEARPYDVTEAGLVLLPRPGRNGSTVYDLDESPQIVPQVLGGARIDADAAYSASVGCESLVFGQTRTPWSDWVTAWSLEESGSPFPALLPEKAHPEAIA